MSDKHIAEGIQILMADRPENHSVSAEHDQIWAGQDIGEMSDETWNAIQKVDGWFIPIDMVENCELHYNEDESLGEVIPKKAMRKCEVCKYARFSHFV